MKLLALVAVLAAGAAGLLAAGVLPLDSESGGAFRPAAKPVERLPPPLPREASQDAVGPLPEPAHASPAASKMVSAIAAAGRRMAERVVPTVMAGP